MTPSTTSTLSLPAQLLRDLVEIPSVSDHEAEAVAWLSERARQDGFRVWSDEVGNFIAEAGEAGPMLWFVGHIDTVPGHIPVRIEDGEMWGRGTIDAKGPLVAAYWAAKEWVGKKGLRVRIVGCVDEEAMSKGARGLDRSETPDWIIVGEPNEVDAIALGYKGVVRGRLERRQDRIHASYPGTSSCEMLWQAWDRYLKAQPTGDGFDDVHTRIIRFDGGEVGARDEAQAWFDVRIPPAVTPEEAVATIKAACEPVTVHIDETQPAALASDRTELAAAFRNAIRAEGMQPRRKKKTATADFNLLRMWYPDVPAVVYGPGDSHLDHGPHERIVLEHLDTAIRVLSQVYQTLALQRAGPAPARAAGRA